LKKRKKREKKRELGKKGVRETLHDPAPATAE
jgi:hypothetical protein